REETRRDLRRPRTVSPRERSRSWAAVARLQSRRSSDVPLAMKTRSVLVGLALLAAGLCAAACGGTAMSTPASVEARPGLPAPWPSAPPSEVGLQEQGLAAAGTHASLIPRFRSLLVARHARLAFERYFGGADATTLFDVRSVTKSVVSALTGTAIRDQAL